MKNYTRIGIIGIIIVSLVAYIFGSYHQTGSYGIFDPFIQVSPELSRYVPGELGQVLVLNVDHNLQQVAQASNGLTDPATFQAILDTMQQVIIYQNDSLELPKTLLFLRGNEAFDITQIEALGLLAEGPDYVSQKINANSYIYADQASLDRYESTTTRFKDIDGATPFLQAMRSGNHNAGFFSQPQILQQLPGLGAQLASQLQYTYLLSDLNADSPSGELILQMLDGVIPDSTDTFQPQLVQFYSTPDTLLYLEVQPLKQLLGIDETTIQSMLPFVASSFGIPLPTPEMIETLISNHIALVVSPAFESPLGLQASLIIDSEDAYPGLMSLYPIVEELLGQSIGIGATSGSLQTVTTDESIVTTYPLLGTGLVSGSVLDAPSLPVLSLTADQDITQLVAFGAPLPATDSDDLQTLDDSVAVFGRDSSLLGQLLGGIMPGQAPGGKLSGSIRLDTIQDQVIIGFSQSSSQDAPDSP